MSGADLTGLTEHEAQNRAAWNADADDYQARHGEQLAESTGLAWGVMQIPEAELRVLGDVAGKDTLEFGCGAAQWSIALAGPPRRSGSSERREGTMGITG